ncbi:hypothetical protein H1D32_02920 [Anaerobacillus sp. CMMVII]|uniref:hypothetical protein n=1 Tax=Anaerobacillus sp. CMMVII TaxID=2755588 RepID=UPI0021B78F54|nr:hypothetical protein [Anaerobacillus sp. CMMVII]MCT8136801.1 hypothetical protein [Anaerobacillus sp. CMMVII]
MMFSRLLERCGYEMDYTDRLNKALMKEKIHEKYIQGKITTKEMEEQIRAIGSRLKKKKR